MLDWRRAVGVALGLATFAALTAAADIWLEQIVEDTLPDHGPVLSDCDGAIQELVIQYTREAAGIVETAYREYLGKLSREVRVYVVCPRTEDFRDLRVRLGPVACTLVPVITDHAMTCWARDRWLAFAPSRALRPVLLLAPREEIGAAVWAQRKGDHRIAFDLEAALPGRAVARRSALAFDGGDFVVDRETAFVTPRAWERNRGGPVSSAAEFRRRLAAVLERRVVILDRAPPHHAGMFMMLAGNRTAVVGDPSLAAELIRRPLSAKEEYDARFSTGHADPDFSPSAQQAFDAVAASCEASGYRVVRIPVVPGRDGRTYLTWLNVIIDERRGSRTVYMPVYRHAGVWNRAAERVWRDLGYRVRRVDCSDTYMHFGSLRCLVNVLRRSAADRAS